MEKQNRSLKHEKDDLHRQVVEAKDNFKDQSRQLKDAHSQRKLAMDEFSEINEKYVVFVVQTGLVPSFFNMYISNFIYYSFLLVTVVSLRNVPMIM